MVYVVEQVRNAHRSTWVHLTEEAQRLQEEVNSAVMAVCQLQSENRRDVHNYRACEELEAMDTDTVRLLCQKQFAHYLITHIGRCKCWRCWKSGSRRFYF